MDVSQLKNPLKTFYFILGNTMLASVMNFTVWFAITFFVYLQTQSVFATGLIAGVYLIFVALSGFWFGSLVDHNKKKTIMIISSTCSFIAYIAAFIMYQLAPAEAFAHPGSPYLWMFVLTLMVGVIVGNIRTITMPVLVSIMIPADKRDKVNGLVGTASGISFLITSVISGLLVGFSGMFHVLLLAIGIMAVSVTHLWFMNIPEKGIAHLEDGPKKVDIRGTLKVIMAIPGLLALIFFTTFNNFLGGAFMALMDAYGLSLVSVQTWGLTWGALSTGFIVGGLIIAKWGLGKKPLRTMLIANLILWAVCTVFTIQPSYILLVLGMYAYMCLAPYIEASEQTILQKVVPVERQGRVFGFAQSVEQTASPITAFLVAPLAQFIFIPFMTTGAGVGLIGGWFGTGANRGIALVFIVAGILGLVTTLIALGSRQYRQLSAQYTEGMAQTKA